MTITAAILYIYLTSGVMPYIHEKKWVLTKRIRITRIK